ncbi:hypothetical protein IIA16_02410 [bacterium]|nr:hypothetical protein [bacterium]
MNRGSWRFLPLLAMGFALPGCGGSSSQILASWILQTVDSAGTVGAYSSIAVASSGTLHISYWDAAPNNDLKHAWTTGSGWLTEVADSTGDVGEYTDIFLAGNDPNISYYDRSNGDLKWARIPNFPGAWTTETADSAGDVGTHTSLWGNVAGLHIAYRNEPGAALKRATIGPPWTFETVDVSADMGLYTSLDGSLIDGSLHVSYYDATTGSLMHAWLDPTIPPPAAWLTEVVDSGGDVGLYTGMLVDGAGTLHISYYDLINGNLKHAWDAGSGWLTEVVDSSGVVGRFTSMAVDGAGTLHISYYDYGNGDLKHAWKTGSGWVTEVVDDGGGGDVGRYTSIVVAGVTLMELHISYYDVTNANLKHAAK